MTVEEYNELPLNEDILIRYSYKDEDGNEALSGYYVVNKTNEGPDYYGDYVFYEAAGEQYAEWNIACVDDWVLCKELDKFFEEKNQPCEDVMAIHTQGLDEGIRCAMCTNSLKSDRGCDGGCVVNKDTYKKVMNTIKNHIVPPTSSKIEQDEEEEDICR